MITPRPKDGNGLAFGSGNGLVNVKASPVATVAPVRALRVREAAQAEREAQQVRERQPAARHRNARKRPG